MVIRSEHNPILTAADVPYPAATVHNAGACRLGDRYILLFRFHRRNGRSAIGVAESEDGLRFTVRPQPFLEPARHGIFRAYEEWGVEDVRISPCEGSYLLTYSASSRLGVRQLGVILLLVHAPVPRRAHLCDRQGCPDAVGVDEEGLRHAGGTG